MMVQLRIDILFQNVGWDGQTVSGARIARECGVHEVVRGSTRLDAAIALLQAIKSHCDTGSGTCDGCTYEGFCCFELEEEESARAAGRRMIDTLVDVIEQYRAQFEED